MTQSGQGDERELPAVRPAHEGVVLPAGGGEPWRPGDQAETASVAGGEPWGGPWTPQQSNQQPQRDAASQGPYGQQGGHQPQQGPYATDPQGGYGQGGYGAGQQGPYEQQGGYGQQGGYDGQDQQSPYAQQPQAQQYGAQPQPYAQPLPPEAGAAPGGDADATQFIAPVPTGPGPGGLPAERPAEATQFLDRAPQGHQQGQGSDADATQYIPPVPGGSPYDIRPGAPGDRQPPAEFDNLFRSDEPAGATQQMPRVPPAQQAQRPYQGGGQPPYAAQSRPQAPYPSPVPGMVTEDEPAGPRKKPTHLVLIAAVVVGCAVIGLAAGALMSGGDKDDDAKQPVASASSPAAEGSSQAAPDPAKPQAEALDKLLADSNNSRSAVISAVEKTKSCTDLDQAVTDLKGAAQQRRDLVTRLKGLSVDKLPGHAELTSSLTAAWQASAAADDHYAAWAAQAKNGKKVCRHGKARVTSETQQATVKSGEASKAKREASGRWNSIATKYGLTRRTATDL